MSTAAEISDDRLSYGRIFRFWVPLAATWLMMAAEGPFLAAVIARLTDPAFNLAAYGVAYSFALIAEAPIIMIMSASTALVDSPANFRRLRAFTYLLNTGVTLLLALLIFTPLYGLVMEGLIGLPPEVARLTRTSLIILLPWPGAIGYRRFYQGLLIRDDLTRRVAYGTVVRLSSMAGTALLIYFFTDIPGAWTGAAALSVGVTLEAAASRLMAWGTVRCILERERPGEEGAAGETAEGTGRERPAADEPEVEEAAESAGCGAVDREAPREPLSWGEMVRFYWPLALTSTISLAVHPVMTFFMGRARFPVESLAVLPVVNSLTFIFRSLGLSYQEVGIALSGPRRENIPRLARFALVLGIGASLGMALVGWTPLSRVWFQDVSGLGPGLTSFALLPTRILFILPGLSVLLSFQRALLVNARMTRPISLATGMEVGGIAAILTLLIAGFDMVGATAAAVAFVLGRLVSNGILARPSLEAARPVTRS
ncbi:MAG: hypothetical protein R6W82_02245 [bacterium]